MGLDVSDRVVVIYSAAHRISQALMAHAEYLKQELLADRLEEGDGELAMKLAGEEVKVSLRRADTH